MRLQVKQTGSDEYGHYVKMLLCGGPGSGKTSFGATASDVLFADAEGGLMSVAHRNIPYVTVQSSADLLELMVALDQPPSVREKLFGSPVKTIVIDTIDEIARILMKERVESTQKEALVIQDWGWLGDQLRGIIRGLRNANMNVIFACHTKDVEDSETGRVVTKPAIPGSVGDEIPAFVDIAVLLTARPRVRVEKGENQRYIERTIQTYPDHNHPWIKDRSGKLPMDFHIDFRDDFSRVFQLVFPTQVASTEISSPEMPRVVMTQVEAPLPAPEPEPVVEQTPEQESVSDPAPVPEPQPIFAPEPESEPVPISETSNGRQKGADQPEWKVCGECGGDVESQDQSDLSRIRFRKNLCRKCFVAEKTAASARN